MRSLIGLHCQEVTSRCKEIILANQLLKNQGKEVGMLKALGAEKLNNFHEYGYCVLDELITAEEASSIIHTSELMAEAMLSQKQGSTNSEKRYYDNPNNRFLKLVQSSRVDAGHVFDALIKIPLVNQIVYSSVLENIAKALLNSQLVLSSPLQMNLRADHPDEDKFLYPWHTDFSYNSSSSNSLVFWIPLQNVDLVNGALHVIPRSHRFISSVRHNEEAIKAKRSSNYFSIENIDEMLQNLGEIRCPVKLGQGMVFHSKLVHKSGLNQSSQTRFALQSRWFDGLSFDAVKGKFRGGVDEGVHPEEYL